MSIERFDWYEEHGMVSSTDGEWVRYDDHVGISRQRKPARPGRYSVECDDTTATVVDPSGAAYRYCRRGPALEHFAYVALRQQMMDIDLLNHMLARQILVIDDLERRRVKLCEEIDQLRKENDDWLEMVIRGSKHIGKLIGESHDEACERIAAERDALRARVDAHKNDRGD